MSYNVTNNNYALPNVATDPSRNYQAISTGTIGALFGLAPGQILGVTPEFARPVYVTLTNVGSIALTVSPSSTPYPMGMRIPGGKFVRFVTSVPLYVAAPPTVIFVGSSTLYPLNAYVTVTIER